MASISSCCHFLILHQGRLLPLSSLDLKSLWRCDKCGEDTEPGYIRQLEENVDKELEMVVDLREQLEQRRESEEREESALRSMEAQQRMLQEAEVHKISFDEKFLASFLTASL